MERIGIKGFSVSQNGQDFIIGKAKIHDLLSYTMYTERLIIGFDEDEKPIYNDQVQRRVDDARANKIADFLINDNTATFPTNIVLGIPLNIIHHQEVIEDTICIQFEDYVFDEIIKAKNGDADANVYIIIIDGQHRIRGIEKAIERLSTSITKASEGDKIILQNKLNNLLNMELVVSCFIDKSLEYQAMIFSTINRTQKRVSQDLVYSLFGISDKDTPYKTALEVTLALNGHPKSPFYKRIKLYGNNYDKSIMPPLSQSTMIKKIVSMISESLRESENDRFKDRKELKQQKGKKFLPFRLYYAENKDLEISNCMFYYFNSVKKYFSELWNYDTQNKPENVLQSTIGFEALMNLLSDILEKNKISYFDSDVFDPYIEKISVLELSNNILFPMTTKGRKIFYYSMFVKVFPNDTSVNEKCEELRQLRGE